MMQHTKKKFFSAAMLCSCVLLIVLAENTWGPQHKIVEKNTDHLLDRAFSFGEDAGTYDHDIVLYPDTGLGFSDNSEIRYTLDGSIPTENSILYKEPITLSMPEEGIKAYPVKASVYRDGVQIGGPYESTYFLTSDPEFFKDVLMVSITSDPEGLFSETTGILYPAKTLGGLSDDLDWDGFLAQNCCQTGPEWIRDAHVEIFEGNKRRVINQDVGLSVSGFYGSLTHYPFSLNIKADDSYEPGKNRFFYDFFHEKEGPNANSYYYDKISFKNGGNDFNYMGARDDVFGCMLRNIVCSELAKECGFTVSNQRMAVLFLNGEFYNVAFTVAAVNEKSISAMTGIPDEQIVCQKLGEEPCMGMLRLKSSYSYPDIEHTDLFEKHERFDNLVDMRELLRYYAFECMIGNTDWPGHNYCLWQYTGEENVNGPWGDNKYRPYIFDLDCAYHLQDPFTESWDQLFDNPRKEACLLLNLLQIDSYREIFREEWLNMLHSDTFSEEHIFTIIDEKDAMCAPLYKWVYGEETEAVRQQNILYFKNFVHEHNRHVEEKIAELFP